MIQQGNLKEVGLELVETPQQHPTLQFLDFNDVPHTISKLKAAEVNRVSFCIREYSDYKAKGYLPRLPEKIMPIVDEVDNAVKLVPNAVSQGIEHNYDSYARLSDTYKQEWDELLQNNLWGVVEEIMGPLSFITRIIVPTEWGMGGSEWGKGSTPYDEDPNLSDIFGDGIIFIKIDHGQESGNDNISLKRKRTLIHEFIAHSMTVNLRANTPLDENVEKCSHPSDKEWLADEITAQVMWKLGYYKSLSDVPRQVMSQQAQESTRKAFYVNPLASMSELKLKHPGDIVAVIGEIFLGIRSI